MSDGSEKKEEEEEEEEEKKEEKKKGEEEEEEGEEGEGDFTLVLSPSCVLESGELYKILMPGSHPQRFWGKGLRCSLAFKSLLVLWRWL